ncbi:MAG: DNA repair protein RecO [Muribaculaceae bacterium]|nr:DNA repair protein RecO [Muribaculaceae bacterium]
MKLSLICLRLTRHSDSRSILTAFSREAGRIALGVPAGTGRGAARLRALTTPLSLLTCETVKRPGQEVYPMRQPAPLRVTASLHSNPIKQMMAMFVAEILDVTLRQGGGDPVLFDYVASAAVRLDSATQRETANFHICFLIHLAEVLGIEPDISTFSPGRVFDMRDGVWRSTSPLHTDTLPPHEAEWVAHLNRMTFSNMGCFRLTPEGRRRTLDVALRYLSIHISPMQGLKSLEILRSL